jgi:hypothetical protein
MLRLPNISHDQDLFEFVNSLEEQRKHSRWGSVCAPVKKVNEVCVKVRSVTHL